MMYSAAALALIWGFVDVHLAGLPHVSGFLPVIPSKVNRINTHVADSDDLFLAEMMGT